MSTIYKCGLIARSSNEEAGNSQTKKRRSRRRVRRSIGGSLDRLQCGQVLYAASYRPLSFGEKVKLKFCKDKEPQLTEKMTTFYPSTTATKNQDLIFTIPIGDVQHVQDNKPRFGLGHVRDDARWPRQRLKYRFL